MKLAYVRSLEYFSPSSFVKFEENQLEFYINRLGPKEHRLPRDPTNMAQACGLLFDESIKSMIEQRQPQYAPEAAAVEGALERSLGLAAHYVSCGAYQRLVGEGDLVLCRPGSRCEVEGLGFIPGTEIPIKGYIDATMRSAWLPRLYPHDWKVTGGMTPDRKRSPNKGYLRLYQGGELSPKVHKLAQSSFDKLHEKWAIQQVFYGWLLGWGIERIPYSLDQCLFSGGAVRIAQYRGWIDRSFVQEIKERVSTAWDKVQREEVVSEAMLAAGPEFMGLLA